MLMQKSSPQDETLGSMPTIPFAFATPLIYHPSLYKTFESGLFFPCETDSQAVRFLALRVPGAPFPPLTPWGHLSS